MPRHPELNIDIGTLDRLPRAELRLLWRKVLGEAPPACLGRDVLALGIAHALQERRHGGLTKAVARELDRLLGRALGEDRADNRTRSPATPLPRTGTVLVREWQGTTHHVTVVDDGFLWNAQTHRSLSAIARAITGTHWNGPRFFAMREASGKTREARHGGE
jgi:hypothetical protein